MILSLKPTQNDFAPAKLMVGRRSGFLLVSTCFFSRTVLVSGRRDNFMQALEAIPWIFPIFTRDRQRHSGLKGVTSILGNQTGHVEEAGNC